MTDGVWLPAIASGICSLIASVLAGIILVYVRRTLTAANSASDHAQASAASASSAASKVTTAQLDLSELQRRMKLGDDADLEFRRAIDLRFRHIETFMAEVERTWHGKTDRSAGL